MFQFTLKRHELKQFICFLFRKKKYGQNICVCFIRGSTESPKPPMDPPQAETLGCEPVRVTVKKSKCK